MSLTLQPLVSVLIPAFNSGGLAEAAVRSALAQSWPRLEVIVVDDGSSDGTPDRIEAMDDPRVQVHRQANAGPSAALNHALRFAQGSLIALLDHDDLWAPGKLATQIAALTPDVDLSFTWSRMVDDAGQPTGLHSHRWPGKLSFEQMLEDFVIGNTSSVIIRREALEKAGRFDPALRLYYDMDLFLRVAALRPDNCCAVPTDLTFYRRHAQQISADWRPMQAEWRNLLLKFASASPHALAIGHANMTRYFAFLAYERRQYAETLQLMAECARLSPAYGVTDARNVKLLTAGLAGLMLPRWLHLWLEGLAGVRISN